MAVAKKREASGRTGRAGLFACLLALGLCPCSDAATLTFRMSDPSGQALESAVVTLLPLARTPLPAPLPARIEQVRKSFMPYVSVVQTGAAIQFPNNDTVRHHVYSFSPAKVFELKLYTGTPARPVVFDKAGVVVLGCNIHDRMVAYVVVADTPWFGVSGMDGVATVADVPPGEYTLQIWHPRRLGQPDLPSRRIRVASDALDTLTIDLKS